MQEDMVNAWNVHGLDAGDIKIRNRTSNGLERYNRHFNGIFPYDHPNLVVFAAKLKDETDNQIQRIEDVRKGREVSPSYDEVVFPSIPDSFADFYDAYGESQKKKKAGRKRVGKRA